VREPEEVVMPPRDARFLSAGLAGGFGFALLLTTFFSPGPSIWGTLAAAAVSGVIMLAGFLVFIIARQTPPVPEERS
jgi:hypothetical protein